MSLPLNINFQQIFLHMLNFGLLTCGLYFLLYKPVKKFMDERTAHYEAMDKEAKEHLENAKISEKEIEERIQNLDQEFITKRSELNKELNEIRVREMQQAQKEAADIISSARENAQREKESILADAKSEIVDFAEKAAEQLLAKSPSESFDDFLNAAERGNVNGK